MHLKKLAAAAAIALTTLSGCYTVTIDARDADRIYSLSGKPQGNISRSFRTEMKVQQIIVGLVTLSEPNIRAAIDREVKAAGGKGAVNVRITHQMTLIDGILGGITFGIYTPTTVFLEGDIVR